MIKTSKQFIYICLLGIGLTACGIRKQAPTSSKPVEASTATKKLAALHDEVIKQNQSWTALKARIDGELRRGDKSFSARIQLQASRGKGIRLSVHYLLFEVARVWFTPSGVTFVDLINGGYAQEAYSQFGERLGITIDYPQIESLILGGVFAPGKGASEADIRSLICNYIFNYGPQMFGQVLQHDYFFIFDHNFNLKRISVFESSPEADCNCEDDKEECEPDKGTPTVFEAEYRSEAIGTLPMLQAPAIAEYRIYSPNKKANPQPKGTLLLEWQSVQHLSDDSELSLQPIIKAKYERIDLGKLLNALK